MISSLSGSHRSVRPTLVEILPRWHITKVRYPSSTSPLGNFLLLTQSRKFRIGLRVIPARTTFCLVNSCVPHPAFSTWTQPIRPNLSVQKLKRSSGFLTKLYHFSLGGRKGGASQAAEK